MDPTTALVFNTFKTCWESFSRWKILDAPKVMSSLKREPLPVPDPEAAAAESDGEPTSSGLHVEATLYDSDEEPTEKFTFPIETTKIRGTLKPHPVYTSCTPASRSDVVDDDPHSMRFIPYADDETFDHGAQTERYDCFQWQRNSDPGGNVSTTMTLIATFINSSHLVQPKSWLSKPSKR
jgi:histone-lysine N-methyltransferase EZH2